jgi:hypothetical protein
MSNLENIRAAANDCVANAKVDATTALNKILESLDAISYASAGYEFLFNDAAYLVTLDLQTLGTVMQSRINEHKVAEQKRIDEAAEKRAQEIAAQERAKQVQQPVAETPAQRQQDDAQAAIAFNNRNQSTAQQDLNIRVDLGIPVASERINAVTARVASEMISPFEEAIRDLETINGLAPALARIVAKTIYDGLHRHIAFK